MSRTLADSAFERGDYETARVLYAQLLSSDGDKTHAQERLAALQVDKLEVWLGLGTLGFVLVAYLVARFS